MKTIYQLPNTNDPTYEKKKELLLWYYTTYLPSASDGDANFGGEIPFFYLPTDRMWLNKKERIRVESASEAFGLLVFENCREKWKVDCQVMKDTGKKPVYKKKDPSTHKWKDLDKLTVWTQASGGRGQGWKQDAVVPFNNYMKYIQNFRAEDSAKKYAFLKQIQQWAREKHGITDSAPTQRLQSKARVPTMQENLKEEKEEKEPQADSSTTLEINVESDDDYAPAKGTGRL